MYLWSIWIQILQLSLLKLLKKKIFIKKIQNYFFQKKKKKLITSCKNCSFVSWNFYGFFFFNSLKYSKIFVIQILYSYHKSSSIHTNVYNFSFVQISNFFLLITILIPINKFKCPIGFQLFTVLYLIFKHYSTLPYILL